MEGGMPIERLRDFRKDLVAGLFVKEDYGQGWAGFGAEHNGFVVSAFWIDDDGFAFFVQFKNFWSDGNARGSTNTEIAINGNFHMVGVTSMIRFVFMC